jgi:hypothetical protein
MRNFSKEGFYIETTSNYKSGTILQLRIVRYPSLSPALPVDATPRSITLAEIKWKQNVGEKEEEMYGFGLKYLE